MKDMKERHKTFIFPKVAYTGTRKLNTPEIEMTLRYDDNKPELSICGYLWNARHTDCVLGGQCLDRLKDYLGEDELFNKLYRLWKLHHLNGLHAGTLLQEQALSKIDRKDRDYYYDCKYLEEIGLLYDGGYKYGTSWLYREIPEEDMRIINELLDM